MACRILLPISRPPKIGNLFAPLSCSHENKGKNGNLVRSLAFLGGARASEFTGSNALGLGKRTNTEAARHFAGFLVIFLGAQQDGRGYSRSCGFGWLGLGKKVGRNSQELDAMRRCNGTNREIEKV
jgi:hypothetical protein